VGVCHSCNGGWQPPSVAFGASYSLALRVCRKSDHPPRDAFQVVDELDDLYFVFAVASSLADPGGRAFANPAHFDIRQWEDAEKPVVDDDVGVVDFKDGGGGELGVFFWPDVANASAGAYAAWHGFSTMGVVQYVVAPVHSAEAGSVSRERRLIRGRRE
jgi:hypothetical protein